MSEENKQHRDAPSSVPSETVKLTPTPQSSVEWPQVGGPEQWERILFGAFRGRIITSLEQLEKITQK